jgi:hypothetical protein
MPRWFVIVCVLATAPAEAQVLHLVPTIAGGQTPQSFLSACFNIDDWPQVYSRTTYLGAKESLAGARPSELAACFREMNVRGLQLTIETGIVDPFTSGREAFDYNSRAWDTLRTYGAPLTALFIDEPLHHALSWGWDMRSVVEQTINWVVLVRTRYPRFRLILIEPYPVRSSELITSFVTQVNRGANDRGVAGLDGLEIDHAWDSTQGPWAASDLMSIQAFAASRRMQFGVIFFGGCGPEAVCGFDERLSLQWNTYRNARMFDPGASPDIYTVESWEDREGGIPAAILTTPENATGTFMAGAKHFVAQVGIIGRVHAQTSPQCDTGPVLQSAAPRGVTTLSRLPCPPMLDGSASGAQEPQ